ncbi:MAG: metalloregulator ArsR/SmtB family transcription factor [Verrucomicrobiota bacterium]|nr:metalloregulator ArsR/SmtB family transcription factor [Verrucomicrobiota bacterium]
MEIEKEQILYRKNLKDLEEQTAFFKALAHPSRLFIVKSLLKHEMCVHDIAEIIGVEMPTISNHLKTLKNAGIIVREKRGSQAFYKIKYTCIVNLFECSRQSMGEKRP